MRATVPMQRTSRRRVAAGVKTGGAIAKTSADYPLLLARGASIDLEYQASAQSFRK